MHVGIRGSVNDHEDITADAELVSGVHQDLMVGSPAADSSTEVFTCRS